MTSPQDHHAGAAQSSVPGVEFLLRLTPELVDEVRKLGLAVEDVNRYGADRVRWVLERLETEQQRQVIANPAGWVVQVLKDTWGQPLPVLQMSLPFAAAAAAAVRPPDGTRWARHREGGPVLEVEEVNDLRVRCAGGFNAPAIPAVRWGEWEWFTERPRAIDVSEPDRVPGEDLADEAPALAPERRAALARLGAWAAVRPRTPAELVAKLEAAGLTLDEWEVHQAGEKLTASLDTAREEPGDGLS